MFGTIVLEEGGGKSLMTLVVHHDTNTRISNNRNLYIPRGTD
jgi:hypothetical protein